MPSLAELQTRRTFECRLEPQRALRSLEDAAGFLHDRGILTRTPDSALPSLFGACHEPPYRAGRGGFADWPATAYPWFWELAQRDDVFELSVHGGKRVLVTRATAALADPICRAELAAAEAGGSDPAQLLRHLASAGPSPLADLKVELEWDAARLRRARRPLERAGALVSHGVTLAAERGGHIALERARPLGSGLPGARGRIARRSRSSACVRAAVLAPQAELRRWFSWRPQPDAALVERLVGEGRLIRPAAGWIAAP